MAGRVKELVEIMNIALDGLENSKDGLTTYEHDADADHGDGVMCGREEAYGAIIKECANRIAKAV